MHVVILCGGMGTRLREETEFRPKPMIPISHGQPILWHIMKYYSTFGLKKFVLCLGYQSEVIKTYFRNYHWHQRSITVRLGEDSIHLTHDTHDEEDWEVTLLDTGLNTLTGGRVKRAIPFTEGDTFLLTYGDGLINSDIAASIKVHLNKKALVTMTAVRPPSRFGELDLQDGMVKAFREKPLDQHYINGGYFVCDRSIESMIEGDQTVFEKQPLENAAAAGRLAAFQHDGFWQCMDTYREMTILSELWQSGEAPWKRW
jgi:glucose-1-phosphate cytidylyltransferase